MVRSRLRNGNVNLRKAVDAGGLTVRDLLRRTRVHVAYCEMPLASAKWNKGTTHAKNSPVDRGCRRCW